MNFHRIQVMLSVQAGSLRDSVYPIISLHARPEDQDEVPHILPAVEKNRNIHPIFPGATTRLLFFVLTRTCIKNSKFYLEIFFRQSLRTFPSPIKLRSLNKLSFLCYVHFFT